jgi:hypothetical protein
MKYYLETKIFQFFKWFIIYNYGICEELDGEQFMSDNRCVSCDASEVCKWIDKQIEFLNWCRK